MGGFARTRWTDPRWLAEAVGWATDRLGEHGHRMVGEPLQVRVRAWSTVLRLPTADGDFWFKANAIGTRHEAALVEALAGHAPGHVLAPLATDVSRGWLLLPDGGVTLRDAHGGATDIAHWAEILSEHAELQRLMAPHVGELVALGVPDLRPEMLPAMRDDLLKDTTVLRIGQPGGLTAAELLRLLADAEVYERLCAELATIGIAASVNHDDLHDNNVFVPSNPVGHYQVFDWGDASVAHPFAVLLTALRVAASERDLPPGDPAMLRLRDAYLEPWTGEFDRPTLIEAVRLALRVGGVSRAQSFRAALIEGTPDDFVEFGYGTPGWLLELYAPTPVEPHAPDWLSKPQPH